MHTQAGQYELSRVAAHDPQQAENTDAVEGGVASTLDGGGGAEDALAGCLEREGLEPPEPTAWRSRTVTGAACGGRETRGLSV